MQLFGYWFDREPKFISLNEVNKLFDEQEIKELLKPLYEKFKETDTPPVEYQIKGVTYKRGELVEVRLSTGDEWQRRVLFDAATNVYNQKLMIVCYNEDSTDAFRWTQIRKA